MKYTIGLVNPKTFEERIVTVELSDAQVKAAHASPDWMMYVQDRARPKLPKNFMPICSAVKQVLQA
jgi:hypothetical protein